MDAKELILQADEIRKSQNMTQAEWSRAAGLDPAGTAICRTYNRGNCKLTTMVMMLAPLGYELQLVKKND